MTDLFEFTRKNWQPARHVWPILAAACLGFAVAVASWFAVSVWEERLAKAKFVALASDYRTVLQTGLDDYLGKLLAVRAFYNASHEVDADEFAVFTRQITQGDDDTMRLVWSPRVTRDERAAFERQARAAGFTDFDIRTWAPTDPMAISPPRDEYFPILYSTVASKRTATFGTDLNSESICSDAIRRARDSDKIATAQGIMLRNQISGSREGFLAVIPAYRHGLPHDTLEDRRRNTLGVIVGAFQTGAVFDSILRKAKLAQNVDLYLYPKSAAPDALPVYMREAANRDQPLEPKPETALAALPSWSAFLKAGDASWKLVITPVQEGLIHCYRTTGHGWSSPPCYWRSERCWPICGLRFATPCGSSTPIAGSSSWRGPIS